MFQAGVPQDGKDFFAVNIAEDGLVTVKNKGRHDVYNKWPELEEYWIEAIEKHNDDRFGTGQWHSTDECMSWQAPVKPFELTEEDFVRTVIDYLMFQRGIDAAGTRERLGNITAYASEITEHDGVFRIEVEK